MTTLLSLFQLTFVLLVVGTITGQVLRLTIRSEPARGTVANVNLRIASWWLLCGVTGIALWLGTGPVVVLFAVYSMLALIEYVQVTNAGSSGPLLYLLIALQYSIVWARSFSAWAILMPVCALVYIAVLHASNAPEGRFLQSTARAYWGWIICCYSLSYMPALLMIEIPWYRGRNAALLFYLLFVVQLSDVVQFVAGKLLGRHPVAPRISPHKTWEGLIAGIVIATATGTALHPATPFSLPQALAISLAITVAGFLGGLAMSTIKRRYSAKDFGSIIPGHGGVLDRADSLCFSAPLYYYIVLLFYVTG